MLLNPAGSGPVIRWLFTHAQLCLCTSPGETPWQFCRGCDVPPGSPGQSPKPHSSLIIQPSIHQAGGQCWAPTGSPPSRRLNHPIHDKTAQNVDLGLNFTNSIHFDFHSTHHSPPISTAALTPISVLNSLVGFLCKI